MTNGGVNAQEQHTLRARIIGVVCATDPRRVGLALGSISNGKASLLEAKSGERGSSIAQSIVNWLPCSDPVLLALDAPLGWPAPLGEALVRHEAGQAIPGRPSDLFSRLTDAIVKEKIGKQPLEVGADRIARTALAALSFLSELRYITGQSIPLAWRSDLDQPISAIEVYPAGTLRARGLPSSGYKRTDEVAVRREIIAGISKHFDLPVDISTLESSADVLDAVVCVVAALDFLYGKAIQPADMEQARKEGWIWVREPD